VKFGDGRGDQGEGRFRRNTVIDFSATDEHGVLSGDGRVQQFIPMLGTRNCVVANFSFEGQRVESPPTLALCLSASASQEAGAAISPDNDAVVAVHWTQATLVRIAAEVEAHGCQVENVVLGPVAYTDSRVIGNESPLWGCAPFMVKPRLGQQQNYERQQEWRLAVICKAPIPEFLDVDIPFEWAPWRVV